MSVIKAIKAYIETYSALPNNSPVWVNYIGELPQQYGIVPIPGQKVLETYLNGDTLRVFYFAFQSTESTSAEVDRLATTDFFDALSDWFDEQTLAGILPDLGENREAESIEALDHGHVRIQGESGTAIYQVQCQLTYMQRI